MMNITKIFLALYILMAIIAYSRNIHLKNTIIGELFSKKMQYIILNSYISQALEY